MGVGSFRHLTPTRGLKSYESYFESEEEGDSWTGSRTDVWFWDLGALFGEGDGRRLHLLQGYNGHFANVENEYTKRGTHKDGCVKLDLSEKFYEKTELRERRKKDEGEEVENK